ncbi:unnamed protein product [Adineta ricciae]|uniref:Reverse transcriptase domain-containing protein n=1 Tax=Adineta ricciae TaxID=249248 RepID=A0A814FV42_ADIRI|nr:unnamed protein product [Adineta ricciae]CAF1449821.1 unnamed protein product [Adineta ricciae]
MRKLRWNKPAFNRGQRLQTRHEQLAREEQAGFRPCRGCCDQVFTLRQLLEEHIRCGKRLVAVFIDFATAFDSVHRPALWRSLVAEGVRQGCVASPLLFNIVVDAVMRKVFKNRHGVQFGDNEFITDLMFADDSVVFAESESEASEVIQNVKDAAYPYGLIVKLDNLQLEQVQQYKYLGSIVEAQRIAATADITKRIGQATAVFGTLTWCFWCKMRIYKSLVLSVLLYGAESWTLLQSDLKKLEVFQMRCLRRILSISIRDKVRNETIRKWYCDQPSISDEIQKRRMRWFGHIRDDLEKHRLSPVEPKEQALDKQQWKVITHKVINGIVAPTAAYWLRGRPPPVVR